MSLAPSMTTTNEKQFIGTRQPRLEDEVLLRGQGRYGDEVPTPPGTLYAAIVRSPHPHARLKAVDSSRALEMDGVHGVLTGEGVWLWTRCVMLVSQLPWLSLKIDIWLKML